MGSGYSKPDSSAQSKEAEERMAKLLADRAAQDAKYFPGAGADDTSKPAASQVTQNVASHSLVQSGSTHFGHR